MRIGKIGVVIIGLVPFNVYGECTPTPDCDAIGYTETSCEGDYLACPFDSTKLKCTPCDSSFRYDCSGENITGGTGSACGGKYASCVCSDTDYVFSNGECVCPETTISDCLVGAIYYPDGKCSNDYVSCQNPVGIIVKDNALVMGWRKDSDMVWASNVDTKTSLKSITSTSNAGRDYNGKSNTAVIISAYPTDTIENNAAIYCNEYAPTGMKHTKKQWYLPAAGELYSYVYGNYDVLNSIYNTYLGYSSLGYYFWSSTERFSGSAWIVRAHTSDIRTNSKDSTNSVACFLAID